MSNQNTVTVRTVAEVREALAENERQYGEMQRYFGAMFGYDFSSIQCSRDYARRRRELEAELQDALSEAR